MQNKLPLMLILVHAMIHPQLASAYEGLELLVPAYGNPCCGPGRTMWASLAELAAQDRVRMNVILNPSSGPGSGMIDPNYITASGQSGPLLTVRQAGATIYGYVSTDYARRPLTDVIADIDRYLSNSYWRGADVQIDGIFLDEMSNDLAQVGYYQSLTQHTRQANRSYRTIGNPGVAAVIDSSQGAAGYSAEDYGQSVDTLVLSENFAREYRSLPNSPWIRQLAPERIAHILHSQADEADMRANVLLARSRRAGMIYITDDVLSNPYDRLPSYWLSEFEHIDAANVDVDQISAAIRVGDTSPIYDFDQNDQVNSDDRRFLIEQLHQTGPGDANLDRSFDSGDLVQVFQAGEYDDPTAGNSRWSTGDWNGDAEFDSSDLVAAFQAGSYTSAATRAVNVPEAGTGLWVSILVGAVALWRRR